MNIYSFNVSTFEFDRRKSSENKRKHGIDFIEARQLWRDPDLIEVPARSGGEERFKVFAEKAGSQWCAVITYRGDRIRIISVRRARRKEIETYQGKRV